MDCHPLRATEGVRFNGLGSLQVNWKVVVVGCFPFNFFKEFFLGMGFGVGHQSFATLWDEPMRRGVRGDGVGSTPNICDVVGTSPPVAVRAAMAR